MTVPSVGSGNADPKDPLRTLPRRDFLKCGLAAAAVLALPGCQSPTELLAPGDPRLAASPGTPTIEPNLELSVLGLGGDRDGLLYVPTSYSADAPAPLLVLLHGAGGEASEWTFYRFIAEDRGVILLAPDSRSTTWDLIRGGFGADVEFIDRALRHTFERCAVDPARIALGGFSDGATYALSLGLSNGGLFTHLIAYSPGFLLHGQLVGQPKILISHGTEDLILPVTASRDEIVPRLRDAGYDVAYKQFEGGHEIPGEIRIQSFNWFLRDA